MNIVEAFTGVVELSATLKRAVVGLIAVELSTVQMVWELSYAEQVQFGVVEK